jgi:alkylated DNA repair dioxygenase AlkB
MQQTDFFSESIAESIANLPQATLVYIPDFLSKKEANVYYNEIQNTLPWRQEAIRIYGKDVVSPRLQSWHGDRDTLYRYSNIKMQPNAWVSCLSELKSRCEEAVDAKYNSVLVNYYRDGNDAMGWHADDESELDVDPTIASLTLGCERTFSFKHIKTKQRIDIPLANGSLLIMTGTTQRYWQHALPRRKRITQGRINLTFRYIYR